MRYFWPVIGHVKQRTALEKDAEEGRLSHAYLFAGPESVGKMTVARHFAQLLQCPMGFCQTCPTCRQIEKGQHIDTLEFADNGESFKIEEMRELLSHLSTKPSQKHKIVLMQNLERVTPEAANSFLKTLEEPIPGVIFLLTTSQPKRLLDTILSRTRVTNFQALSEKIILDHLMKIEPGLDAKTAQQMATFAMGKPGRAMRFLREGESFERYQTMYQQLVRLFDGASLTEGMLLADEVVKDPLETEIFLELFAHATRGLLFQKLEGAEIPYSYAQLFGIVDALNRGRTDLEHNVNARMVLEHLVMTANLRSR